MKTYWKIDVKNKQAFFKQANEELIIKYELIPFDGGVDLKVVETMKCTVNPKDIAKLMRYLGDELVLLNKSKK